VSSRQAWLIGLWLLAAVTLTVPASAQVHATPSGSTTDVVSQGIVAILLLSVFVLLAREAAHRVLIVVTAVAAMWLFTYLTPYRLITFEAAKNALDLNVLLLLASMMAIVGVLKSTGVFEWGVSRIMAGTGGRANVAVMLLIWFTGTLSALADNVTTVVFLAPMSIQMASRLGIRPTALLLPMVMAANIGGAATLIGDPPNIMIGSGAGLSFLQFILNLAVPATIMLIGLEWITGRYYRGDLTRAPAVDPPRSIGPVIHNPRLLRWGLAISAGVFIGFITHSFTGMPAAVPAVIGGAAVLLVQDVLYLRTRHPSQHERVHGLLEIIEKEIEWPTLTFFIFLFIAVGAAVETGLIDALAEGLTRVIDAGGGAFGLGPAGTLLFAALLILWTAGILSALIDNIPFVAVSIPIVAQLTGELQGDTIVLWWALALGACLGGNATVVGASANVTVVGLAERSGARITFADFSRFGVPVAIFTLLVSSAFVTAHIYVGARTTLLGGTVILAALLALRILRRARIFRPRLTTRGE
jgi:Na+/H+ antiporter NhaD/arsenite permease-like protein